MKSSFLSLRAAAAVLAASAVFVMTVVTGGAQQPPAAGAPQAPAPGAPGAAGAPGRAGGGGAPVDGLGEGPWEYGGGRGRGGRGGGGGYRVTVVARGLDTPWGIAFVPNGDMLVTERAGNLRVIRNGVLDPTPISGVPALVSNPGQLGGLLDVTLHPKFAENRWIYLAYSKQDPDPAKCPNRRQTCSATLAVARAKWDGGSALADVKDIIVTKG